MFLCLDAIVLRSLFFLFFARYYGGGTVYASSSGHISYSDTSVVTFCKTQQYLEEVLFMYSPTLKSHLMMPTW